MQARSRVTLKQKGETVNSVWSVDSSGDDCDYVPRLAGAGLRVTAQREHRAVPLHTFTGLVTAPGLPSGDTAPLVTSPRIPHLTGELNWNPRRKALSM